MGHDLSSDKTQWSLIVRAQGEGPGARAALGQLLQRYEHSIMGMIRCFRHPPNQTPEEIKQEFLSRVLARGEIARLDSSKGSFRAWLKRAVTSHLCNVWDAWHAHKNPDRLTDHPDTFDAAGGESPEQILDRKFAADTLSHVQEQLRLSDHDVTRFDALKRFLPGPDLSLDALEPIATSLGMTRTALSVAIHRLRERFEKLLTEAIADTLDVDPTEPGGRAEVEREKRLIYQTLCDFPGPHVQLRAG